MVYLLGPVRLRTRARFVRSTANPWRIDIVATGASHRESWAAARFSCLPYHGPHRLSLRLSPHVRTDGGTTRRCDFICS
jgi:hypothetical protein